MSRGSNQPADNGAIIREVLAAILRLPDDTLRDVYDYVRHVEGRPAHAEPLSARELRHLPVSERRRILKKQAEAAAPYYQDAQETADRMAWQAGDITNSRQVVPH
jgi:hypothetical protein